MRDKIYKEETIIENRFGRNDGRRMPEGYLDSMITEVMAKLPERPAVQPVVEMTRWQKLKPYVYLAAMFAGIWMMMQVFHTVAGGDKVSLDNPPERIAMIVNSPESNVMFDNPVVTISDFELEDEMAASYANMEEFEEAFEAVDSQEN